ncbi:MAG: hypothetical protein MUE85_21100 [Microscillaceae bacterium]|jgi:hypothetical protein|nr:hypothetical protein [Microscillaceae bacterium]
MYPLLRKILFSRQAQGQLWFAGIGLLLGLLLLLVSLQVYLKISELLTQRQKDPNYLIISKKVSLSNTLFFAKSGFSSGEIADLQAQPFIEKVGSFTANQYEVTAFAKQAGFYSEAFFESVPDEFLDARPEEWTWNEKSEYIPLILSQDMLDLYNFGFSMGKGGNLPQISRSTAALLPISVRLRGVRDELSFQARIVGFSERIPTILVPPAFMEWANQNIGEGKSSQPSRLIVKVKSAGDSQLAEYFARKNYQINQERLNANRLGALAQNMMSAVGILGAFFIALSLVVFFLNFRVILAESQEEVRLLLQLGYTASMLARTLIGYFLVFLAIISLLTALSLYFSLDYLYHFLRGQGLEISLGIAPPVIALGLGFVAIILIFNVLAVFRLLQKYS